MTAEQKEEPMKPDNASDLEGMSDEQTVGEALVVLRNEIQGLLGTIRDQMISAAGYTNVCVLERKIADADRALVRDQTKRLSASRERPSDSHELEAAKKDAASWKHHWQMYRDAWVRELGGWLIPKSHEIDSLVLTTRQRCVNPILGNCKTPHWLGEPTPDKKALQQRPHPIETKCRNWEVGAERTPEGGWVRVEERLPDEFTTVLIAVRDKVDDHGTGDWREVPRTSCGTLYLCGQGIIATLDDGDEYETNEILGWRPLPEPPSGEPGETK